MIVTRKIKIKSFNFKKNKGLSLEAQNRMLKIFTSENLAKKMKRNDFATLHDS